MGEFSDLDPPRAGRLVRQVGYRTTFLECDSSAFNLKVRPVPEKLLYLLVEIRVRTDGNKEFVALADRYRELTDSRDDLLPHGRSRRMTAAVRTVGDSGFGFWAASRDTFSATRERRCLWRTRPASRSKRST